MSIRKLLREGLLKESMDVYIKGYNYQDNINTLSDVLHYIDKHVNAYLVDLIGEQKFEEYRSDGFFAYDGGSSPYKSEGTINFYLWNMPLELAKHTVLYINELMQSKDILIMPKPLQQSGAMNSKVFKLDVYFQNSNKKDTPPEINMSNSNAYFFFSEILKYSRREFEQGEFPVQDMVTRINFALKNMGLADYQDAPEIHRAGQGTIASFGYNEEDVKHRLELLKDLCTFAHQNGYNTILVH